MRTKRIFSLFMLCAFGIFASLSQGGDDAGHIEYLLQAPLGVFDIESEDGQIVRLKIKGEADVPTSMRASRADRYARERANRSTRAAFSTFLGERVIFSESDAEGVMIQAKTGQETSDVLDTSARLFTSASTAILNGLVTLLDNIEGEGESRICMVVLGWSKKSSSLAGQAKFDMQVNVNPASSAPAASSENRVADPVVEMPQGNTTTVTRIGNLDDF